MKFCFWGDLYRAVNDETRGGGELQIALLIKYLAQLNYKISIIDTNILDDKKVGDYINFISLKKRLANKSVLYRYYCLYKLLRIQNADYYYVRIRSSIHLLSYWAAKKNNGKFIIGLASNLDALGFNERYQSFYKHRSFYTFIKHLFHSELIYENLLKKADYVIAQHIGQQEALRKKGISAFVIPNMIEFNKYERTRHDSNAFVYIGSLDKRKGFNEFLKIVENCPTLEFKIIGRCRDSFAKERIRELESKTNIIWLGQIPHSQVMQEIANSAGLLSTSLMEGFPNVFLEAWSYGKPVFSLHVNPGSVIDKNKLGQCFNGDLEAMINLLNAKNYKFSSNNIINYVHENHDPERNIQAFTRILNEN